MSTCPDNDIHSVYIDHELPAAYTAEYEAHVASCPDCRREQEKLLAVHQALQTDAKNITLDQRALDESFARLEARMSYSRVTKTQQKRPFAFRDFAHSGWIIPAAAAAAFVLAFMVPLKVQITSYKTADGSDTAVQAMLSQAPGRASDQLAKVTGTSPFIPRTNRSSALREVSGSPILPITPLDTNIDPELDSLNASLSSIDAFKPDFDGDSMMVQITLDPITMLPVTTGSAR